MDNFFLTIEDILEEPIVKNKIDKFYKLEKDFHLNNITFTPTLNIKVFSQPSYTNTLNVVHPTEIKSKKNFHEKDGMASLLHSIAHIEYSAIDLALDACYRFQDLPLEYYKDWIKVASDEVRHFTLIIDLMRSYDIKYGDLPVHQGLFDASMKSLTFIQRMALIPRYMEANGLDSNALIISKLKKLPNTQKVVKLFELILQEEIDHVRKGDLWYKYGCSLKENFKCNYFDIVNKIHPNAFKTNKNINVEARKLAGFSDEELKLIEKIN